MIEEFRSYEVGGKTIEGWILWRVWFDVVVREGCVDLTKTFYKVSLLGWVMGRDIERGLGLRVLGIHNLGLRWLGWLEDIILVNHLCCCIYVVGLEEEMQITPLTTSIGAILASR